MSSKYSTTSKDYHRDYYLKYKDTLKYRRDCVKISKVSEDIIAWKTMMEANPNCFYPFAPLDISTASVNSTSSSPSLEAIKYS
jgi:hypothetical protein